MKKFYRRYIEFIIFLGLTISVVTYLGVKSASENIVRHQFYDEIDRRIVALERELSSDLEVLGFVKRFFDASEYVSDKEFRQFTQEALRIHPSIQALEWIPKVLSEQRAEFERTRRSQYPTFEFTERRHQGDMVRAEERAEYFPVYYLEPLQGNEAALGFDLASNEVRRQALMESRLSGEMVTTAGITLVQEQGTEKGFLVFVPVYEGHPETEASRFNDLRGFVLGVFRISDIIAASFINLDVSDTQFRLIDNTISGSPTVLHSLDPESDKQLVSSFRYEKPLMNIGGRYWTIEAFPTQTYLDARKSWTPELWLITGLAFTAIVIVYLVLVSRQADEIQGLVEKRTEELHAANQKLELLTLTDALTGVVNRRGFDQTLEIEWSRAIREGNPITLLIVDVDYFKFYNDHYGHIAGDECLKKVAKAIAGVPCRLGDLVARYGGEEFGIILPNTDDKENTVANKCRAAVEALAIRHDYSPISKVVTVSVGASTLRPQQDSKFVELIQSADEAMYLAKSSGRNRVVKS